ncbi:hypothetical protein XELAEV_18003178mg [Xenopus laevis]|nr:hypothetical protein XELAEV_18003178mg [Xenopus laevis]
MYILTILLSLYSSSTTTYLHSKTCIPCTLTVIFTLSLPSYPLHPYCTTTTYLHPSPYCTTTTYLHPSPYCATTYLHPSPYCATTYLHHSLYCATYLHSVLVPPYFYSATTYLYPTPIF